MKTLLVIEDDPCVMNFLRCMLTQYNVVEATTAEEALLLFIDRNHQVDLLVADLTLPGMSGIQTALHLRARMPGLPVILTSGYPVNSWSAVDSAGLRMLNSNWLAVEKPFHAEVLLNAICKLTGTPRSDKDSTEQVRLLTSVAQCETDER